jgi:pimeloyl-ACP methyl ester carboxylesterase
MEPLTIAPPRVSGALELADGRMLGFAEYGDPHGRPILWFHGTPGGRRQIPPVARTAAFGLGVRLMALERPGVGDSSPHLYPNVLGWADDVGEIADRLGIDRFAAIGLSGGGPYVLACAARHGDRMTAGALLGGVAPSRGADAIPGGLVGALAPVAPIVATLRRPLGAAIWAGVQCVLPMRELALEAYIRMSPPGDRRVFRRPEMRHMFLDDIVRATRRRIEAPLTDLALFARDWGFALGEVRVPIRLWHGDADNIVPLAHGEHLAARLPDSELRIRPGESHLGGLDAAEEVLGTLLDLWPGPATGRSATAEG